MTGRILRMPALRVGIAQENISFLTSRKNESCADILLPQNVFFNVRKENILYRTFLTRLNLLHKKNAMSIRIKDGPRVGSWSVVRRTLLNKDMHRPCSHFTTIHFIFFLDF
jgi:hypothetical protein